MTTKLIELLGALDAQDVGELHRFLIHSIDKYRDVKNDWQVDLWRNLKIKLEAIAEEMENPTPTPPPPDPTAQATRILNALIFPASTQQSLDDYEWRSIRMRALQAEDNSQTHFKQVDAEFIAKVIKGEL